MEKELNYLSEKIEYIKESINVGEGIDLTKKDIEDIFDKQLSEQELIRKSDFVVANDPDKSVLKQCSIILKNIIG